MKKSIWFVLMLCFLLVANGCGGNKSPEGGAETGGGEEGAEGSSALEIKPAPTIAHGMFHLIGSIEVGKLADLVLWKPSFFGAKPELVIKGGVIAWPQMGDPNASIPTPQPSLMRPMFGAHGKAVGPISVAFVSQLCEQEKVATTYGLEKQLESVKNCRGITKNDMKLNNLTPEITVDPETYRVTANGEHLTCEPAESLPLAQRYFLF